MDGGRDRDQKVWEQTPDGQVDNTWEGGGGVRAIHEAVGRYNKTSDKSDVTSVSTFKVPSVL